MSSENPLKAMKTCPVAATLDVLGRKWSILVLRDIYRGRTRFNQMMRSVRGINPKTLSQRLWELEGEGLVERRVSPGAPVRVEYMLTEKGRALRPILESLAEFSMRWYPERVFIDGKPRPVGALFEPRAKA